MLVGQPRLCCREHEQEPKARQQDPGWGQVSPWLGVTAVLLTQTALVYTFPANTVSATSSRDRSSTAVYKGHPWRESLSYINRWPDTRETSGCLASHSLQVSFFCNYHCTPWKCTTNYTLLQNTVKDLRKRLTCELGQQLFSDDPLWKHCKDWWLWEYFSGHFLRLKATLMSTLLASAMFINNYREHWLHSDHSTTANTTIHRTCSKHWHTASEWSSQHVFGNLFTVQA